MNKTNLRKHFFKKEKPCPALQNDIELTDDVKEYILNNRTYNLKLKKEEKVVGRISLTLPTTKTNYIYLVRAKENVKNNENVYKVGKTAQDSLKRIKSYGTGTELLLIKQCIDSDAMEQKILKEFNKHFPNTFLGTNTLWVRLSK
jgi:hypothetical protein